MSVGRPKAIESPQVMLELFEEYRKEAKSNPILKHTVSRKVL
jgi:hypothetical protein